MRNFDKSQKMPLKGFENKSTGVATKELVNELKKREGVAVYTAEPYKKFEISVQGPAIILVITD